MKHLYTIALLMLLPVFAYSQSQYSMMMLQGNTKLKEGLYEAAIEYYQKATECSDAPSGSEKIYAEKLKLCNELIVIRDTPAPVVEEVEEVEVAPATDAQPSDTADTLDFPIGKDTLVSMARYCEFREVDDSLAENDSPIGSIYDLYIFGNGIVIDSHTDPDGNELPWCPKGLTMPLISSTPTIALFSSGVDGETFYLNLEKEYEEIEGEIVEYFTLARAMSDGRLIPLTRYFPPEESICEKNLQNQN